jgi:hypothetical protein
MAKLYEPPTRRQHVHMVRDGDEVVIHFTNPGWREGTLVLSSQNGVLSMKYSDTDGDINSQIVKLSTE